MDLGLFQVPVRRERSGACAVDALIGTVHERLAPRQAPLQERSFQPFAGVAVNVTGAKDRNAAEHRGRQVMPERELRIAPRPATATAGGTPRARTARRPSRPHRR